MTMKSIKTQGYYQTQLLFYFKFLATCFDPIHRSPSSFV